MTQQQQIVTVDEEAEADDFDAMMTALDIMFHVHECPNHSGAERMVAYAQAKQAFATYCGFDSPAEEDRHRHHRKIRQRRRSAGSKCTDERQVH